MFYRRCLSCIYKGRMLSILQRGFHTNIKANVPKRLPDQWDLATGLERWQLIQFAKGNIDPFLRLPVKRGPGTKDCPNVILSFEDKKVIGCHCHPDNHTLQWWWLHECYPRRCECNYWFVLKKVELPNIYEC